MKTISLLVGLGRIVSWPSGTLRADMTNLANPNAVRRIIEWRKTSWKGTHISRECRKCPSGRHANRQLKPPPSIYNWEPE